MKKNIAIVMKPFAKVVFIANLLMVIAAAGFSQAVGINASTSPPDPSAGVDIDFANRGLLIPRVSLVNTSSFVPLSAHVTGMMVFNTATGGNVTPGFYLDNGTQWVSGVIPGNAAGELMSWNGNAWGSVAAGQTGQYLQAGGSGAPSWTGVALPVLSTTAASSITSASAISGGDISGTGGSVITVFGVCWSTAPGPTTALVTKTIHIWGGAGPFASTITGLATGTTYYVRAYATNLAGTAYGNQIAFTTP